MKVKALLVDDEEYVRRLLAAKISKNCPEIDIIGEARDGDEAYEKILALQPDLLFLDISMPRMGGFELLKKLPELNFEIIFVTSYDQYAIEAIEFCAIGYLVKPVSDEGLIKAVNNALSRISSKQNSKQNTVLLENLINMNDEDKKIAIPSQQGMDFVPLKDIVRCEGYQKYTKIFNIDGTMMLSSYNIGKFANMLEPYGFFKPHKSHLINSRYIVKYFKEGTIVLKDGSNVPLAKRKKHDFIEYVNAKFE